MPFAVRGLFAGSGKNEIRKEKCAGDHLSIVCVAYFLISSFLSAFADRPNPRQPCRTEALAAGRL